MFIFSKKKYWVYILIGGLLLTLFCFFEFYDYKISSSLNHKIVNWFTIIFDNLATFITAITVHIVIYLLINIAFKKMNKKSRITLFVVVQILCFISYISYLFIVGVFKKEQSITFSQRVFIGLISLMLCYLIAFTIWWIIIMKADYANVSTKQILMYITYLLIVSIITNVNKSFFGRNRPYSVLENGNDYYYAFEPNFSKIRGVSFNSGHANGACMLLGINFLLLSFNNKFQKLSLNILIWTLIILTSLSRILIWAHWSTDVTYSIILNITTYYLIYYLYNRKWKSVKNG